jgi:hypothetical protein
MLRNGIIICCQVVTKRPYNNLFFFVCMIIFLSYTPLLPFELIILLVLDEEERLWSYNYMIFHSLFLLDTSIYLTNLLLKPWNLCFSLNVGDQTSYPLLNSPKFHNILLTIERIIQKGILQRTDGTMLLIVTSQQCMNNTPVWGVTTCSLVAVGKLPPDYKAPRLRTENFSCCSLILTFWISGKC